ncbi:MAG: Gfo/Idh/MocA family oxidoreductase [Acidimicrobiales bacterium]|nr:Gfo/Idh/MocA family oxidoreductase [Acidimicrobiales bacterium]
MPREALGAVIVGTGFGVLTHLRAMQAAGIDVLALVGRDATKAHDRASRFGVPLGTDDLDAALALADLDVVAVATPPHTHSAIVHAAVHAGKHVVCEKPFARDRVEAVAMLHAAEAAGVIHLLGTEFRFDAGQAQLARVVSSGAIGTPQFGQFELAQPTHADPAAELPDWWQLAEEGGGWLGAYGSHVVDQIRTTMGEPVAVSASLQRLANRPAMTADDTYSVLMRLDNDATVLMHSTCASRGPFLVNTRVVGMAGTAWVDGPQVSVDTGRGVQLIPMPDDLPLVAPDPPPAELLHTAYDMWHSMGIDLAPYTRLYARLIDLVAGNDVPDDPPAATFADGVAGQAVLDAIRASSADGGAWTPVAT